MVRHARFHEHGLTNSDMKSHPNNFQSRGTPSSIVMYSRASLIRAQRVNRGGTMDQ